MTIEEMKSILRNKKIFIAYDSNDAAVAKEIWKILDSLGATPWIYDHNSTHPNFETNLDNFLRSSDVFVLIYSRQADMRADHFVASEFKRARDFNKPIIPFLIDIDDFKDIRNSKIGLHIGNYVAIMPNEDRLKQYSELICHIVTTIAPEKPCIKSDEYYEKSRYYLSGLLDNESKEDPTPIPDPVNWKRYLMAGVITIVLLVAYWIFSHLMPAEASDKNSSSTMEKAVGESNNSEKNTKYSLKTHSGTKINTTINVAKSSTIDSNTPFFKNSKDIRSKILDFLRQYYSETKPDLQIRFFSKNPKRFFNLINPSHENILLDKTIYRQVYPYVKYTLTNIDIKVIQSNSSFSDPNNDFYNVDANLSWLAISRKGKIAKGITTHRILIKENQSSEKMAIVSIYSIFSKRLSNAKIDSEHPIYVCYQSKSDNKYIGCIIDDIPCDKKSMMYFGKYPSKAEILSAFKRCIDGKSKHTYIARISKNDKINSHGDKLTTIHDILHQDRANYYKHLNDPEDTACGCFRTKAQREMIDSIKIVPVNTTMSMLKRSIIYGNPKLEIIFDPDDEKKVLKVKLIER